MDGVEEMDARCMRESGSRLIANPAKISPHLTTERPYSANIWTAKEWWSGKAGQGKWDKESGRGVGEGWIGIRRRRSEGSLNATRAQLAGCREGAERQTF